MIAPPVREHTLDLIGDTPLVRLAGPSAEAGCDIFGKCEFANPGASVKDRAALGIIRDAEARGESISKPPRRSCGRNWKGASTASPARPGPAAPSPESAWG